VLVALHQVVGTAGLQDFDLTEDVLVDRPFREGEPFEGTDLVAAVDITFDVFLSI
jgi:hypothetical protein